MKNEIFLIPGLLRFARNDGLCDARDNKESVIASEAKQSRNLNKALVCLLLLLVGIRESSAQPTYGFSTWGRLRYPADFTHYDHTNPQAPKGGHVHFGVMGRFDSLNPFIVRGDSAPGIQMTIALLMDDNYDEVGTCYCYLAQGIEVSADRLSVIYDLNPQAHFNNGEPITSEDVLFSFEALKSQGQPMYRSYFADISKAEALGPHKVKFTFKNTHNRELPLILGQLPILSAKYYKDHPFDATNLTAAPCSGPYEIEKIDPGRSITYRRVASWWGENIPSQKGRHNFARITYDMYRDNNALFEAFKSGSTDIFSETRASRWKTGYDFPALTKGFVKKLERPSRLYSGASSGFFFNTRRPIFQDKRARQALTEVFDFAFVNHTFFYDAYKRNHSYFPESSFEQHDIPKGKELEILRKHKQHLPPELFTQAFSLPDNSGAASMRHVQEKASKLLKEAGWVLENNVLHKEGKPFHFEILIADQSTERILLPYVNNLKKLGVEASVRLMDTVNYINRVESLDFDMIIAVIGQSNSLGNEQRNYWGSSQANKNGTRNYAGIHDPVVDELIESVIGAADYEELVTHAKALDRVLLWGHYMIPYWHQPMAWIAYWDRFDQPAISSMYATAPFNTWWINKEKDHKLQARASDDANKPSWWQRLYNWIRR
ncbi:MAG: extracellular solute-binding protein [Alphaproteobacteria bacterium]